MTEYRTGRIEDEADILDFINFVFSQSHRPHDFRTLISKVYAHEGFSSIHEIAVTDGRIRGNVALLPQKIHFGNETLMTGYIGSVSTHPYDRGAGHMKAMMKRTMDNAKAQQMDVVVLGGQRQRYGFYGFERGAAVGVFFVNQANVRHGINEIPQSVVLRPVKDPADKALPVFAKLAEQTDFVCERPYDRLFEILTTWYTNLFAIETTNGETVGELCMMGDNIITEVLLSDEKYYPAVVRAYMDLHESATFNEPICRKSRISFLLGVAENWQLNNSEMVKVINWRSVIEKLLQYKAERNALPEGTRTVEITDFGTYTITVDQDKVTVEETSLKADRTVDEHGAVRMMFSALPNELENDPLLHAWFPLPLYIQRPDQF